MKVCFIAGTLGRGGAERQLLYMLQALIKSGIDTRVLSITKGEPYEAQIREFGVSVEWIGESGSRFVRLGKIVSSLRKDRPDIVQSSHFYTNFYAATAGKMLDIASVGAIRSNLTNEMRSNRAFGHLHLRMPRALIANSRSACATAIRDYSVDPARVNFVPNVVREVRADDKGIHNSVFTVLFAGRLVAVKRPGLFVKLATRLMEELPFHNLQFVIAGDGPLKNEIQTKLQIGPYGRRFSMLGEVADMSAVYRTTDLLVMTSSYEGTPNVILEAMVNGIPVVATNVGGIPDLLGENRGLLVDADDLEEMVTSTKRIIEDEKFRHRLVRNGSRYVAENHSISQLQSRLVEIYKRLNGDKPR